MSTCQHNTHHRRSHLSGQLNLGLGLTQLRPLAFGPKHAAASKSKALGGSHGASRSRQGCLWPQATACVYVDSVMAGNIFAGLRFFCVFLEYQAELCNLCNSPGGAQGSRMSFEHYLTRHLVHLSTSMKLFGQTWNRPSESNLSNLMPSESL